MEVSLPIRGFLSRRVRVASLRPPHPQAEGPWPEEPKRSMEHESTLYVRSRGRPWFGVLAVMLFLVACGGGEGSQDGPAGEAPESTALARAYASPSALAEAVLAALKADDAEGFNALRVTREEHLRLFWSELPESDDTPFEFAWQLNDDRSREGIGQALAQFGGQEFELIELTFTEPSEVYSNFTVHFGAELRARRASDGKVGYLPILDVIVERQGLWKLLNVRED